ncbi:hypothetical protein ABKN59_004233 [Abortiporus biennis]
MSSDRTSRMVVLPTEIVHGIFEYLGYKELGQACQVCRRFYDIIYGSATLQYKFEVAAPGLVEGPAAGRFDLRYKRDLVKRYRNAWDFPSTKSFKYHTIPADSTVRYGPTAQYCEGVIAIVVEPGHSIEFILLGSPLHGIEEKRWKVPIRISNECTLEDISLCPAQDLFLVSFSYPEAGEHLYGIEHFQMSTGERHEKAYKDTLHIIPPHLNLILEDVYVVAYGCIIGMAIPFEIDDENGFRRAIFRMWNWHTGTLIMADTEILHYYWGISFLDENHILRAITWETDFNSETVSNVGTLSVIDIRNGDEAFSKAIQFQLPSLSEGVEIDSMLVMEECSPPNIAKLTPGAIFEADKQSSIVAVEVSLASNAFDTLPTEFYAFQVIIRNSKLLELATEAFASRTVVHWGEWGPMNTRVLELNPGSWSLFGARVMLIDDPVWLKFFDFNVLSGSSRENKENSRTCSRYLENNRSMASKGSGYFERVVSSSLPYYDISTNIQHGVSSEDSFMLSDSTILIFDWFQSGRSAKVLTLQL